MLSRRRDSVLILLWSRVVGGYVGGFGSEVVDLEDSQLYREPCGMKVVIALSAWACEATNFPNPENVDLPHPSSGRRLVALWRHGHCDGMNGGPRFISLRAVSLCIARQWRGKPEASWLRATREGIHKPHLPKHETGASVIPRLVIEVFLSVHRKVLQR